MLIKVHQLPRQPHSTGHSQDLSSCHSHYDMSVWWAMLREEIQISLGFLVGYCWLGWKAINQVAAEFTAMHPYVCLGFMCWALVKAANKIHRWNPPFHVLPFGMTTCDNDALKLVQGSCYPWYSCFWAWCIWQCGVSSLGWWSQTCHRTMSPARCGVMLAFNGTGAWRIYGSKYDSWWYDIGAQVWCKTVKKNLQRRFHLSMIIMWEPKLNLGPAIRHQPAFGNCHLGPCQALTKAQAIGNDTSPGACATNWPPGLAASCEISHGVGGRPEKTHGLVWCSARNAFLSQILFTACVTFHPCDLWRCIYMKILELESVRSIKMAINICQLFQDDDLIERAGFCQLSIA